MELHWGNHVRNIIYPPFSSVQTQLFSTFFHHCYICWISISMALVKLCSKHCRSWSNCTWSLVWVYTVCKCLQQDSVSITEVGLLLKINRCNHPLEMSPFQHWHWASGFIVICLILYVSNFTKEYDQCHSIISRWIPLAQDSNSICIVNWSVTYLSSCIWKWYDHLSHKKAKHRITFSKNLILSTSEKSWAHSSNKWFQSIW